VFTPVEQIDILYQCIRNSTIPSIVTGGVYKYQKPVNSESEDIVINSITTDGEMIQRGVNNINIHVPPMIVTISGLQQKVVNNARLTYLIEIITPILKEGFGTKYNFWVDQMSVITEDESWLLMNYRIKFKLHNTN